MKTFVYRQWKTVTLLFLIITLGACTSGEDTDLAPSQHDKPPIFEVMIPKSDPKPSLGEDIHVKIKINDWSAIKGNVTVSLDGKEILTVEEGKASVETQISTDTMKVGAHRITTACEQTSGKPYIINKRITILSDVKPGMIEPELVQMYPHSESAFTQGLTFWGNKLLEGTGLNKESSVRLVDLVTGDVLRKKDLDAEYFGEGITMHDNKLYQITWKSQVGFIYDPETFTILDQFGFQTRTGEGWGLTSDGEHLIVSDGTSTLYFVDDSSYNVVKKLSVADNVGLVDRLNELEYYDGSIWANIYGTEIVVEIEAVTGKVLNKYDMAFLRGEFDPTFDMDVFNGIAIDPSGRIFVTGKRWPRLMEVKIPEEATS